MNKKKLPADLKKKSAPVDSKLDREAKMRSSRRQALKKAMAGKSFYRDKDPYLD